jgi:hypothetical protein
MIAVGKRGPCFGIFQCACASSTRSAVPRERASSLGQRPAERILLVATLCRAAPGALQSCNEPIGPKKDTGAQIPPRIWLTDPAVMISPGHKGDLVIVSVPASVL